MPYKLENMLSDCAVIRTTFETLDLFPPDDPIRDEMLEIVDDARGNLVQHCAELRDNVQSIDVLGQQMDKDGFRDMMLTLILPGYPRRRLDATMKLNVFQSVAEQEAEAGAPDPLYHYAFAPPRPVPEIVAMRPDRLASVLFDDLLRSVLDTANYADKFTFDRNVFQKYIALLFACYASTDPLFDAYQASALRRRLDGT